MRALILVLILAAGASSAQVLDGNCIAPVLPAPAVTLVPTTTLGVCNPPRDGQVVYYAAPGEAARMCLCMKGSDNVYRFQNLGTGSIGTNNSCPITPTTEWQPSPSGMTTVNTPASISAGIGSTQVVTATVAGATTDQDCTVTCPPALLTAKVLSFCAVTGAATVTATFVSLSTLTVNPSPTTCAVRVFAR